MLAGSTPRQSPPSPPAMLLLLHLLPAVLPPAALASCSGAGAERQLVLAKVRARVLEHLSPPVLQEEPQKEARRLHRRDVLENAEVQPEEPEDTSQVILFPSTGEPCWDGEGGGVLRWGMGMLGNGAGCREMGWDAKGWGKMLQDGARCPGTGEDTGRGGRMLGVGV